MRPMASVKSSLQGVQHPGSLSRLATSAVGVLRRHARLSVRAIDSRARALLAERRRCWVFPGRRLPSSSLPLRLNATADGGSGRDEQTSHVRAARKGCSASEVHMASSMLKSRSGCAEVLNCLA